jgi:hypothetical protein
VKQIIILCCDYSKETHLRVDPPDKNLFYLILHCRYKLEEAVEAFETARSGVGGAIKVMIKC